MALFFADDVSYPNTGFDEHERDDEFAEVRRSGDEIEREDRQTGQIADAPCNGNDDQPCIAAVHHERQETFAACTDGEIA